MAIPMTLSDLQVATSLSCTVSHILILVPCIWLPVTLKSPSLSRQLKLRDTYALPKCGN